MAKTRVAVEFGMGTSLRREDYTKAAISALKDALWHNSLTMAQAFGFPKEAMLVDVEVAVQEPDQVDLEALKAVLPYGTPTFKAVHGGLDIAKPDGGKTVIANAAVVVSFDMEPAQ
ncbi:Lin0512 family protein [Halocynthiibacter namhaensis]|uniref:Lin0512 family protein n=1 Tax=Halocynthiibacter namhaensis TaxID=1290553 RepID=UPI0005793985|nr:Lin0512 family protein [Halocynthiibacter namhaensis]